MVFVIRNGHRVLLVTKKTSFSLTDIFCLSERMRGIIGCFHLRILVVCREALSVHELASLAYYDALGVFPHTLAVEIVPCVCPYFPVILNSLYACG